MEAEKCREGFIHGTRQGHTNPSGPAAGQGMQDKIQNRRIYSPGVNHFLVLVFRAATLVSDTPFNPLFLLFSSPFKDESTRYERSVPFRFISRQQMGKSPSIFFFFLCERWARDRRLLRVDWRAKEFRASLWRNLEFVIVRLSRFAFSF